MSHDETNETADAAIRVSESTRTELRKYKADDGLTYDEAVRRLLADVGWFTEQQKEQ